MEKTYDLPWGHGILKFLYDVGVKNVQLQSKLSKPRYFKVEFKEVISDTKK